MAFELAPATRKWVTAGRPASSLERTTGANAFTMTSAYVTINNTSSSSTSSGDGAVVFWELKGNGCAVETNVAVGSSTQSVTSDSSPTPACGASGTATFTLPAGTYSYTASCNSTQASQSSTTDSGSFTVAPAQCTAVQLIWN
jgi:hypothetical protein